MKLHPTTLAAWFPDEREYRRVTVCPDTNARTPGERMFYDLVLSDGTGIMLRSDGTWYPYRVE